MQFTKKTSSGKLGAIGKFSLKFILVILIIFIGITLISKIEFPAPNKQIQKIIPNENFKTIK